MSKEKDRLVFTFRGLSLEYKIIGHGDETIFAFHGFGQSLDDFHPLYELITPRQRIVSIHLFQHGDSRFPEERIPDRPLTKLEFAEAFQALAAHLNSPKFSLLGYSLGGKVCLNLLEILPEQVQGVLLFAPDGFKTNKLYSFSSKTALGRSIYRYILNNPKPLFKTSEVLNASGLISDGLHRFVLHHMRDYEQRKLVYETWLIYRNFDISKPKIAQIIRSGKVPLKAFFGKYDKIIRPEIGQSFFRDELQQSLHILDSGHLIVNPSTTKFIHQNGLWLPE